MINCIDSILSAAVVVVLIAACGLAAAVQDNSDHLDKSWTNGGPAKNNGSQVVVHSPLTSRVSLYAERTGFSEHLPAAVHNLQQRLARQ